MTLPELLPIVAEPLRLRILNLLASSPLCVQHLQSALDCEQVTVSKQLVVLREKGLVTSEKLGMWRLYKLSANPSRTFRRLLECLQACVTEEGLYPEDAARLAGLRSQVAPFLRAKKDRRPMKTKSPALAPLPPTREDRSAPMEDHLL
jgi:ArsR family transcriptional regulator